jgi:hypothetical protein
MRCLCLTRQSTGGVGGWVWVLTLVVNLGLGQLSTQTNPFDRASCCMLVVLGITFHASLGTGHVAVVIG